MAKHFAYEKKFGGFLTRRECWGLSWQAKLLILLIIAGGGYFCAQTIQPFLARTQPVDTNVLVVEGWIHEYAIRVAVKEFQNGHYEKIYTTGGPIIGAQDTNDFNTSASVGAELLKKDGVPKNLVQMVPAPAVERDRTYSSAVALRDWFGNHSVSVSSFNILTEDVHARRSQMLFQKAFGPNVTVGVIAVSNPDYDPAHWWRYSEGVRDVLDESIAYLYAKFFFKPSKP